MMFLLPLALVAAQIKDLSRNGQNVTSRAASKSRKIYNSEQEPLDLGVLALRH
jgi:hypothetical protein